MITPGNQVKLLDFGIAKLTGLQTGTRGASATTLTQTGAGKILGTAPYMSPEQIRGDPIDARSDLFSFGCVLYEMLTARQAFLRKTSADTIAAILKEDPIQSTKFGKDVPPGLIELIKSCLKKNPEDRPSSAKSLVSELKSILSAPQSFVAQKHTSPSYRRTFAVILVMIAATFSIFYAFQYFRHSASSHEIRSIAVLPLKNLSDDPQQEYFADAMTEELISSFARIGSVRVISRTSVMGYKEAKKPIPEIAKELNVDAVLEGSVLLVKDRIRITAQLIDGPSDRHLWAQTYDRDLKDVLALQNEVASAIADEIRIQLTPQEKKGLLHSSKVQPAAYQAYLRGKYQLYPPDLSDSNPLLAVQMFERAIQIDPSFALAYAELSHAHCITYFYEVDRSPERLTKAKSALDRAFQLQPDLPQAHVALGYYYYAGSKNYATALGEYALAEKSMRADHELLELMAAAYRRIGNYDAAINQLKKAFELSPREALVAYDLAITLQIARKYEEAEKYFDIAISFIPDQPTGYFDQAWNYLLWKGDKTKARALLEKMPNTVSYEANFTWFFLELTDGNYLKSLEGLGPPPKGPGDQASRIFWTGYVYDRLNRRTEALSSYEDARKRLEKLTQALSGNEIVPCVSCAEKRSLLAETYAALGRKADAVKEAKQATEMDSVSRDAVYGPDRIVDLAFTYVLLGDFNAAIDQLETVVSKPARRISIPLMRIDPRWDPLRRNPRFQKLVASNTS
jgi:TolB-like protein/Flp pilus assembly protein TadD